MSIDNQILTLDKIQNRIFTIRGLQVMLDSDLALLYQTETRTLKQAVRRNIKRFPADFMFELTNKEIEFLVSQSVIPSKSYFGGSLPFAFTEQGVSMLSAIIRTSVAIEISLIIIRAFVEMRKFITMNAGIFQRLDKMENKQLEADGKFEQLFKALDNKSLKPKQGIFYDGQLFDAYVFIADLIKSANKSIVLIDNYVDESVLQLLTKRNKNVMVNIYTKNFTKTLQQDLKKHNSQYPQINIKTFARAHDRFLIIDESTTYHFGASLKDLGKKWFAFSKMDSLALDLLNHIKEN